MDTGGVDEAADRELVRRCLEGSASGAAEFYDRFAGEALRTIYAVLGSGSRGRSQAEDILQEVFLELFSRSLARFGWRCPLRLYVMDIARKRTISHIRVLSRPSGSARNPVALGEIEPQESAQDLVEREHELQSLAVLRELDPGCFELLTLRWVEDLKPRHIAERMELTSTTVRQRIKRCRDRFRDLLVQRGWGPESE